MTDLAMPYSRANDLLVFASEAGQVHNIAKALSSTSFVPKPMQGRPDEITAVILFGREIGLSPMVALQSVHVIEGRPSLSALAMRGKAQAAGVKFRLIESTATRCRYAARAPGDTQDTEVLWTMDRAKQLGLTGKANWLKQPTAMLIARATSELCRLVAANVFLGYAYSAEELRDGVSFDGPADAQQPDVGEDPPPPRTVRRRTPVQATVDAPEPPPAERWDDPAPVPEIAPVPAGDEVTVETRKAVMAAFSDNNIRSRDDRLARCSQIVGREIHSVNQLTQDEAKKVIADLRVAEQRWPDAEPVAP